MAECSFSPAERAFLLHLAREAAAAVLSGKSRRPTAEERAKFPRLWERRACFTTFKRRDGELRGCLGTLEARAPLAEEVARLAAETVTEDPRFYAQPVTADELPQLVLDVSVLHPSRPLRNPLDLELGADGITVEGKGSFAGLRGAYLPQVATEHHMAKEEFLNSCCAHKASLPEDAWRDPKQCVVRAFRAEVLSE